MRFPMVLLLLAGCMVSPAGEQSERDRAAAAGVAYQQAFADRGLPAPQPDAPLADYIACAERRNGELEASWQRWQAALAEVPQASMQESGAMLGAQHTLDGGAALDRTTFQLMNDAMNNLMFPGKLAARGEAALARARVAAAAFDQQRLQLQTMVAERFLMLAQRDAEILLVQRLRATLQVALPSIEAQVRAGASGQAMLLAAQVAVDRADAELAELQASRPALLAALRAVVGAGPEFAAAAPQLPALQPLLPTEEDAVAAALQRNPALQQARAMAEAALAEQRLAEWRRVPEFSLNAMLMGSGVWTLGGAVSLPFVRDAAITGALQQAAAERAAAVAMQRQAGNDAVAAALAESAQLRAVAAQAAVLQGRLLPRLNQLADLARASWVAGRGEFAACSEATAMAIDVERMLLRLQTEHALGRARLQAALGRLLTAP